MPVIATPRPPADRRPPTLSSWALATASLVALAGVAAGADDLAPPPGAPDGGAAAEADRPGEGAPRAVTGADPGASERGDFPEEGAEEEVFADESVADALDGIAFEPASVPAFEGLPSTPADLDFLGGAKPREDGRLQVETAEGTRLLTVDAALQRRLTDLLARYRVPYGAVTAVEPSTGRVLAMAESSRETPAVRGLNLRAVYPAASVFKIVTGAALLASGVSAEERVCFHGGKRRLNEKLLADDARHDGRCLSLAAAMGQSANVVFAKLAGRALDSARLRAWAERLGFNAPMPFAEPTDVSPARIPEDGFGFANTAAGFGEVFLSPLHGALLAGAVGNGGVWMSPVLFEGEVSRPRRVLDASLAGSLSEMLETTVTTGTARRAFRERGRWALGPFRAAGKTGSLADKKPYRDFTWFVGWAPKENPRIAVAAVVVNGAKWSVRAPYVAREAMRMYLDAPAKQKVAQPRRVAVRGRRHRGG